MRNFKDLSRALASIAGGLKGIKDIIDTIEPGGGGGSAEWTLVSGSGSSSDTWSTTATDYDAEGKTEVMLYVLNASQFIPPFILSLANLDPFTSRNICCRFQGSSYANITVSISDNTLSIATTEGNIAAYVYLR